MTRTLAVAGFCLTMVYAVVLASQISLGAALFVGPVCIVGCLLVRRSA